MLKQLNRFDFKKRKIIFLFSCVCVCVWCHAMSGRVSQSSWKFFDKTVKVLHKNVYACIISIVSSFSILDSRCQWAVLKPGMKRVNFDTMSFSCCNFRFEACKALCLIDTWTTHIKIIIIICHEEDTRQFNAKWTVTLSFLSNNNI